MADHRRSGREIWCDMEFGTENFKRRFGDEMRVCKICSSTAD